MLVAHDVEPPLVCPDLVGGLIDVDEGGVSQPTPDLLDESGEASGRLGGERGDEPVDTLAPSMADVASAVRSTERCWPWRR